MGKKDEKKLNTKQKLFALEYIKEPNATKAAIAAGYSKKTAYAIGHKLLKIAEIQRLIESKVTKKIEKAELSAEKVLKEIANIAFFNIQDLYNEDGTFKKIHELPEHVARAIASIEATELLSNDEEGDKKKAILLKKIKIYDKKKNLENLGRYFALFTDQMKMDATEDLKKILKERYPAEDV